jgi:5-hydroxyisourate hydrolase-like protein (transthyretin family)
MSVNSKHLATFLLGAAAAYGAYKYSKLTDEEKEKLANDLKDKAGKLKDQAVAAEDKAAEYFNELRTKAGDSFKEYMPKIEEFFGGLFSGATKTAAETASSATDTTSGSAV